MVEFRPYQASMRTRIRAVWKEGGTPLAVLPTGGGKTVIFAKIVSEHDGAAVVIAHRRELVGQISLALAREGLQHTIIAPSPTVRGIVRRNAEELGRHCYAPASPVAVASVDSIHRAGERWRRSVSLWVVDEGHHPLKGNKWGRAIACFPGAKGLGVTATPERADGKGLGPPGGFFTHLVNGPPMRWLIEHGFLSEYRVFAPPSSLDRSKLKRSSSTGDFVQKDMQAAVAKAQITGDVVAHYQRYAAGKLGITFAVGVQEAHALAAAYNAAGVPAAVVHAKTPDLERAAAIRRFTNRELLQLVNVDIFGEGFDLPAIEAVSFVRPTESWPLYCQSFGRALRPMAGKTHAIIIDHVGNVIAHGLPDAPREHSLETRRVSRSDAGPQSVKSCPRCAGVFLRINVTCPYCGHEPAPLVRSSPEQVDGDLVELDAETLALLRAEVERMDRPSDALAQELFQKYCPPIGIAANVKRHEENQEAQRHLRYAISWWRGLQSELSDRECYRLFYLQFGVDVLSAHALKAKDADALRLRILAEFPFAARCLSS